MEYYSHNYLNYYNLSNYEDFNNSINFKNFSFTKNDLIKNFNKDKGFYQPFLAYKNSFSNNKIKIIGGRHRYQALLNIDFLIQNKTTDLEGWTDLNFDFAYLLYDEKEKDTYIYKDLHNKS